jgi:hypothetical protein
MITRVLTVSLVSAVVIGAYVGCGDATDTSGGGLGSYHSSSGGPVNNNAGSSSGSTGGSSGSTGGSSGGSSGGSTGSSSGGVSGSSSGGVSGSSSGGPAPEAGPPPMTLQEAFTEFANCMAFTDFTSKTANGVAAADIAKSQTTQYGDCNACHNAGDGGFWASYGTVQGQNMTQMMFDQTKTFPYIAKWVTGTVDTNGQFKDLAPSNAIQDQAILAGQCAPGTPCHPKFQLNPAVAQAITDFVTKTITNWHNKTCTPGPAPSDAGLGGGG